MAKHRSASSHKRRAGQRLRAQNANTQGRSGAGGCQDRGANTRPLVGAALTQQELLDLWRFDWAARKIVVIPVADALREEWSYTGLDGQENEIARAIDNLGLVDTLRRALIIERLLGGSAILMGVQDTHDKPDEPLDTSTVREGDLRFINVIPRSRLYLADVVNDPFSPSYGKPAMYTINGKRVHESRLLVFDGQPLTYDGSLMTFGSMLGPGFGDSVLQPLMDDLMRATGTRQAAFHLVNTASLLMIRADIAALQSTNAGSERIAELEEIAKQLSLYRAALVDNGPTGGAEVSTLSTSFGSVPELLMSFLQVLSAASDIPATRFLGQAPGGMNATGDSDLENYYNSIDAFQAQRIKPQLLKLLRVLHPSVTGKPLPDGVDIEFPPLWNLSDKETAEIRQIDATVITTLASGGVIGGDEAYAEAKERGILIAKAETNDSDDDESGALTDPRAALAKLTEVLGDADHLAP
jgi:phage-related protein (TIGR01555 family)